MVYHNKENNCDNSFDYFIHDHCHPLGQYSFCYLYFALFRGFFARDSATMGQRSRDSSPSNMTRFFIHTVSVIICHCSFPILSPQHNINFTIPINNVIHQCFQLLIFYYNLFNFVAASLDSSQSV